MAKSKSGEFYRFDEVLRQLNIDENRLKRLVSEGEIRAFREGDQMKFKRAEIDTLAGKPRGGASDTSLSEISLEDEPAKPKKKAAETLTDDLLNEPDLTKRAGMRTAEISSQDTFIDQGGGDVGMSTEPIDFTEEVGGDEPEQIGAEASAKKSRAAPAPAQRKAAGPAPEPKTGAGMVALLFLTAVLSVCGALVVTSVSKQQSNSFSKFFAEKVVDPVKTGMETPK